jgi:beta-lactamase class A
MLKSNQTSRRSRKQPPLPSNHSSASQNHSSQQPSASNGKMPSLPNPRPSVSLPNLSQSPPPQPQRNSLLPPLRPLDSRLPRIPSPGIHQQPGDLPSIGDRTHLRSIDGFSPSDRRAAPEPFRLRPVGQPPEGRGREIPTELPAAANIPPENAVEPKPIDRAGSPRNRPRGKSTSLLTPVQQAIRLLVWGVGISTIAGTLLSLWNPATQSAKQMAPVQEQVSKPKPAAATTSDLNIDRELTTLKAAVEKLTAQTQGMTAGVLFVDLDTGDYLAQNDTQSFAAASTIKLPILVAFFQAVDAGTLHLNDPLTLQKQHIAGGSGSMQYDPPGTKYTALEVVRATIVSSDNTATNMLIEALGGIERLNQTFQQWGLTQTSIANVLPDLTGTNLTSPRDLAQLIASIASGQIVSLPSRDRILDIMKETENDSLLPQGLGKGAKIAHKTGDIASILADAGLVDLPNGKRYIAVAIVQRPTNDDRAGDLIRQISSLAYQHFERTTAPLTAETHSSEQSTQQARNSKP